LRGERGHCRMIAIPTLEEEDAKRSGQSTPLRAASGGGLRPVLTATARGALYRKAVELAENNGWFLAQQFETAVNADIHEHTTAREIIADFGGERLDVV